MGLYVKIVYSVQYFGVWWFEWDITPIVSCICILGSQLMELFSSLGGFKACGLAGGIMSLGWGWGLCSILILSSCFLLLAYDSRRKLSACCSSCHTSFHASALPSWTLPLWNHNPKLTPSPISCLCHCVSSSLLKSNWYIGMIINTMCRQTKPIMWGSLYFNLED